jgi:pimeloyl-ACP methyl ester carboxylesterase
VDEFLRAYLTPSGRAAFYAAARQIYLEAPDGDRGFWPRLRTLQTQALFVWGRRDRLVPIAFARHVAEALPRARHLELDCGHVPSRASQANARRTQRVFFGRRRLREPGVRGRGPLTSTRAPVY